MNDYLIIYTAAEILGRTKKRKQETKIGERVKTITAIDSWRKELISSPAKYVLLGLPEDIGVRANYGRGGSYAAWKPALDFLLNMQSNDFLSGDEILVAGHVDFSDLMEKANALDYKKESDILLAREIVSEADTRVCDIITAIAAADKIPVVVGGGHNNAYGIIKGMYNGKNNKSLHVINCDPHADMRMLEGRHSGNGFHYAFEEKYLAKYAVFGLHESYNTQYVLDLFKEYSEQLYYETYDDIFVRECIHYFDALKKCIDFVSGKSTGIEIDLDAIQNVPVSARTPSAMLPVDVRKFVWHCAETADAAYLHIAEGAPVLAHKQMDNKTGKLIAYLITDFIKAMNTKSK